MNTSVIAARRRIVGMLAVLLVATLPVLVVGARPAAAAAECTDETHFYAQTDPLQTMALGCDDVTPPQATIVTVTPSPNSNGFIRTGQVRFDFTGAHADDDTGAIEFECQFYNTVGQPQTWNTCTSPQVFANLEDYTNTPYVFRVRAIDADDDAIKACDAEGSLFDPTCLQDPDIADFETVGDVAEIKVDSKAPNTFLNGEPFDDITPDRPVISTRFPTVILNSNEAASFACTLNGKSINPCQEGLVSLGKVKPGQQTFIARAVDRAGNIDTTAASTSFFVPKNIRKNKTSPWRKVRQAGLFGNDYLTGNKVGQIIVVPGSSSTREIRILAPTGPRYGKIEVRVGTSQWYTVDLYSKQATRLTQLLVRDEFATPRAGKIQIRVKSVSRKKPTVRVDAIVVR
jgi:hypothetical protein